MKILHVTDCLNAGVLTAIETIISIPFNHEHHLLWDFHSDSPMPSASQLSSLGKSQTFWKGSAFKKTYTLWKIIRESKPDLLHLHSSKAGFIGRIIPIKSRIAYSPHAFSFQRTDIGPIFRALFRYIEKVLSWRTSEFIANWPVEIELMRELNADTPIRFVPLVQTQYEVPTVFQKSSIFRFISIGRVRPQKDPQMFMEIANRFKGVEDIEFIWIGGTLDTNIQEIPQNNVTFIPWQGNSELRDYLKSATALIITSAWESGPLTMYESVAAGVPCLLRDISALKWLKCQKFSDPLSASNLVKESLLDSDYYRELLLTQMSEIKSHFASLSRDYRGYPDN